MSDACTDNRCSVSRCDIFDFMAKHVGLTVIHPGGLKATRALVDSLGITKESKVVDIACGKGSSALYLAENYGCDVIGIDISADLVQEAQDTARRKNLGARVTFQVGDAMELPFPDNSFDVALSQAMLVLVEDKVSNVLCAYCMTNVSTYDGWKRIFRDAGITNLLIKKGDILQEDTMNIRRSTLPARGSTRSIITAIIMLIGILILAWGYYGGTNMLIGLGLVVVISGVVPQVVFGLLGQPSASHLTRRHI